MPLSASVTPSAAPGEFSIASLNLHKGLSPLNTRLVIHDLRRELHALSPDIVFLQEVQEENQRHAARFKEWPTLAQSHFLAGTRWNEVHYGRNARYDHGHHGNAILTRFAVARARNDDISAHRFEHRGMLHADVVVNGVTVHCFCVHLALTGRARNLQLQHILRALRERVGADEPVIIAGDFNDWRQRAGHEFTAAGLTDVFLHLHGASPRTFPARAPLLRLDRIYVRNLVPRRASVMHQWAGHSDHLGLHAELALK